MLISASTVVTGEAVLRPGWLEVEGALIGAVGAGAPPRSADVALGDATVVPGFVDMHSHGGGGAAFTEATVEATRVAVELHRRHGTTAMMASLVSAQPTDLRRQVERLREHVQEGLVVGIHLEGPWLALKRCGAHDPAALRDPDPAEVEALFSAGRGTIRMVTIAPELEGAPEAIRRIVDSGALAALGHTDATYDQTRAGIDAGARVATHLFNGMRSVHHREPGPAIALTENPQVLVEMITDGTHLHPALYRSVSDRVGRDRVALITDAMAAAGMPDGAYTLGALPVEVEDGTARIAGTETIAGSTATMDQVFRFAVTHSSLPRDEALLLGVRQASLNPARVLGLDARGLAPGAPADLVALDSALQVAAVLHRGCWLTSP